MEVRPSQDPHTLTSLPYDLLLAISQHLAYQDVLSLTQVRLGLALRWFCCH